MRSAHLGILSIVIGCILSMLVISHYFSGDKQFENLALGTQTIPYQARYHDTLIHVQHLNDVEEAMILAHINNRKVIFFLGNSQTHSINQKKDGQVNFIELLNNHFQNDKVTVRCNSMPNAGMQEYYLAYQYWKPKFNISHVVISCCMDDMREDGIRDVFFPILVYNKYQINDTSLLSKKINEDLRAYWSKNENTKTNNENADMAALKETVQESTETYLNDKLDNSWALWRDRKNVRGEFFNWIYKFRNTVLRIKATTIRQMIPERYAANMQTLNAIVDDCVKRNVKVVLYIPPIRFDVKLPYDEAGYKMYKQQLEDIAAKYPGMVFYKNFESIVPAELWGYKEATNLTDDKEIDFMHFQYKGHQILADSFTHFFTVQNPLP
jgi:hypothetical protein